MTQSGTGSLLELFGAEQLNEIQERLSKITKLGFITVNYRGEPMTEYTGFCSFCSHFRNDPELSKNCIASDAMSSIQAAISKKPLIYQCPCGLMEIAIPIVVDGTYLGGFLCGQALCSNPPDGILQIRPSTERTAFDATLRRAEADRAVLPVFDYQHFEDIAALVNLVITLLCEGKVRQIEQEAGLRLQLRTSAFLEAQTRRFAALLQGTDYLRMLRELPDFTAALEREFGFENENLSELLRAFASGLSQAFEPEAPAEWERLYSLRPEALRDSRETELWLWQVLDYLFRRDKLRTAPVLDTVFQYLNQHITERLTLSVLVDQCRISQSYLSRLFRTGFGISVTDYIHKRKILRAKQMLLRERKTVGEIALAVGYNEYTYFSKVFRKYEGISLQEYRNAGSS